MADIEVTRGTLVPEHTGFRLSWGAIFAGFIIATMIQIVLALLGIAVGFTTWDVGDPARDLGMGLGLWIALSSLIALFVGGLTTGRLAGVLTRGDGALHGVVMWGLAMLVNLWLLASGAGFLLGGAFDILSRTVAAGTQAVIGGAAELGGAALSEGDLDPAAIQREIEAVLAESGRPGLSPDTLQAEAEEIRAQATAREVSNEELAREIQATLAGRAGEVDRQAIINVVTARTDLTRPEAERIATRVDTLARQARAQISTAVDTVGAAAEDVASAATDYAGTAAWWALLALALGAGAAAWGATFTARD